jgi:hypothetical protein
MIGMLRIPVRIYIASGHIMSSSQRSYPAIEQRFSTSRELALRGAIYLHSLSVVYMFLPGTFSFAGLSVSCNDDAMGRHAFLEKFTIQGDGMD